MENLSQPLFMLTDMNNQDPRDTSDISSIFGDPVAYLANFGIDAELISETSLPAAA